MTGGAAETGEISGLSRADDPSCTIRAPTYVIGLACDMHPWLWPVVFPKRSAAKTRRRARVIPSPMPLLTVRKERGCPQALPKIVPAVAVSRVGLGLEAPLFAAAGFPLLFDCSVGFNSLIRRKISLIR
jgi:hypothetical protein